MDKNFQMLDSKIFLKESDQKELFKDISELFKILEEGNLERYGNFLRKTIEFSLNSFASYNSIELPLKLKDKIDKLKEKYYFEDGAHQAIMNLKSFANRESHSQKGYKNKFIIKIDIHEAWTSIKYFWILLKWMRIKNNTNDYDEIENYEYLNKNKKNVLRKTTSFKKLKNNNEDIKVETITFSQLVAGHENKFSIPVYQRDYTWKKENIKKLINDLVQRHEDNKTHYFGALAIAIDDKNKVWKIIDGQQRITTCILIFKVFYEMMTEYKIEIPIELKKFVEEKINKVYINQGVLSSQKSILSILKGFFNEKDRTLDKTAWNNMQYFKDFLKEQKLNGINIKDLYRIFAQNFELAILFFDENLENEMDIFINLNTGGVKLKDWDLIKNFLFSRIEKDFMLNNEEEINKIIQNSFIVRLNDCTNNKHENALKDFLSIYLRYEFINVFDKAFDTKGRDFPFYEGFREIWNKKNSNNKIDNIDSFNEKIEKMKQILSIYIEFKFLYKNDSKLNPFSNQINLITNKLDFFPIIINSVYKNFALNEDNQINKLSSETKELFYIIESFIVKTDTYGFNMSELMDKFLIKNANLKNDQFNKVYWKYLKNSNNFQMANNDIFKQLIESNKLKTIVKKNILINLELNLKDINPASIQNIKFSSSIEHIIAKKINYEDYSKQKDLTKEEFDQIHLEFNEHMGNLMILSQTDNSKAQNKPFIEKKNKFYKQYGLANNTINNINLMNLTKFTYDNVKKRSKAIANYVVKNKIYYED